MNIEYKRSHKGNEVWVTPNNSFNGICVAVESSNIKAKKRAAKELLKLALYLEPSLARKVTKPLTWR